jgi:hypothetical protein
MLALTIVGFACALISALDTSEVVNINEFLCVPAPTKSQNLD